MRKSRDHNTARYQDFKRMCRSQGSVGCDGPDGVCSIDQVGQDVGGKHGLDHADTDHIDDLQKNERSLNWSFDEKSFWGGHAAPSRGSTLSIAVVGVVLVSRLVIPAIGAARAKPTVCVALTKRSCCLRCHVSTP